MCNKCKHPFEIEVDHELEKLKDNLDSLKSMRENQGDMSEKDATFAESLYNGYVERGGLTDKQWDWVSTLTDRVVGLEPIYGSFIPILTMFRLTQSNGPKALQKPRIRLMSDDGVYVELRFKPGEKSEKNIDVYIDGWQGHGFRKFAGWVLEDKIIPYKNDRMTADVKNVIQSLAMDPMGVSRAMAAKLECCIYCGKRLSDDISKIMGYGAQCADNYGLVYPK